LLSQKTPLVTLHGLARIKRQKNVQSVILTRDEVRTRKLTNTNQQFKPLTSDDGHAEVDHSKFMHDRKEGRDGSI
jgi:hypothetical protein